MPRKNTPPLNRLLALEFLLRSEACQFFLLISKRIIGEMGFLYVLGTQRCCFFRPWLVMPFFIPSILRTRNGCAERFFRGPRKRSRLQLAPCTVSVQRENLDTSLPAHQTKLKMPCPFRPLRAFLAECCLRSACTAMWGVV